MKKNTPARYCLFSHPYTLCEFSPGVIYPVYETEDINFIGRGDCMVVIINNSGTDLPVILY